jgi:hypothetical protein
MNSVWNTTAMPKTLAEKHGYKGVEYGVQPDGPGKWKWVIYPQIRGGIAQKRGHVTYFPQVDWAI